MSAAPSHSTMTRTVIETMGTVASIETPPEWATSARALGRLFGSVEGHFSLYRADSELSRIAAGTLALPAASAELRASYERAIDWRAATGGLFSPERPDGVLDLNGIVKADAIAEAGGALESSGCPGWSINVGGDILVSPPGGGQVIGIADPDDDGNLLCSITLEGSRRAVATSGSAQRGDHIWLGGSTLPAHFRQVSVVADDIVTADVLATAIVAGGPEALDDLTARWDIDVLTVDRTGDLRATPGFRAALAS